MTSVDLFVGKRIQRHRMACGVQLEDLAWQLDIGLAQIHDYEAGRARVSAARLMTIAQILKVPVATFFAGIAEAGLAKVAPARAVSAPAPESRNRLMPYFDALPAQQQASIRAMVKAMAVLPAQKPTDAALPPALDPDERHNR